MIYVIGPSHIHPSFTKIIAPEIKSNTLFANCILDGYPGLPNWSNYIHTAIAKYVSQNHTVVWLVGDYKFNNTDYDVLASVPPGSLTLDTVGKPNNVVKSYCTHKHITCLAEHSLAHVDFIVRTYPTVKVIFWCLYKRTKANTNSSYPPPYWYDSIKCRYPQNIIDIDNFTTPSEFNKLLRDEGAHPNKAGYALLDTMIRSITPLQVSPPTPLQYSPSAQTSQAVLTALSQPQRPVHPPKSSPSQSKP